MQVAHAEQVSLILANVLGGEFIERLSEITAQVAERQQVGPNGILRIITTLELFEHRLLKKGHRDASL